MSKIIIVGASGYIGCSLYERAKLSNDVLGTSSSGNEGYLKLCLNDLDCFDFGIIHERDVVIVTAAISSPDMCENQEAFTKAVNVTGTIDFISNVINRKGRVIFFSSDTVYGEMTERFDESAVCDPVGNYAKMKHEVEQMFLNNSLFKSIRLSYVFSKEDKFTQYIARCARDSEEAEVFYPFRRAVIHRDDVVQGVLHLASQWDKFQHQIYNFGGPDIVDRIDFVRELKENAFPDLRFKKTVPGLDFFKNRPKVISMTSKRLEILLDRPAHSLHDAVLIEFGG